MEQVNFLIVKPVRQRNIPGNPPYYPSLVRITKKDIKRECGGICSLPMHVMMRGKTVFH